MVKDVCVPFIIFMEFNLLSNNQFEVFVPAHSVNYFGELLSFFNLKIAIENLESFWIKIAISLLGFFILYVTYRLKVRKLKTRLDFLEKMVIKQSQEIEGKKTRHEKFSRHNPKSEERVETPGKDQLISCITIIINKNILINELRKKIAETSKSRPEEKQLTNKKTIQNFVNDLNTEKEWNEFHAHFKGVYKDFAESLKARFPDLSNNDLKLCSLYRMNVGSKEISDAMDISLTTLKMARYRLRKKLNLSPEEDLNEFLKSL